MFWKLAPTAVALTALAVVVVQTVRLHRLEKRLEGQRAAPSAPPDGDAAERKRLQKRLRSLEGAVRRLVSLALTSDKKASGKADPVLLAWIKNELKDLRDDVDSVLTGEALSTDEGKKRLKALLAQARSEERATRRKRWQKVAQKMLHQRLKRFAEDHDVDRDASAKIEQLITDERDALRPLWTAFKSGDKDPSTALAEARAARLATDKKVRALLNDSQYEAYEKMRRNSRVGRFLRRY